MTRANARLSHTSASLEPVLETRVRGRKRQVHHERRQALETDAAGGPLSRSSLFVLRTPPSLLSGRLSDCGGLFAASHVGSIGARSLVAVLGSGVWRVFIFDSWLGRRRARGAALAVVGGSASVASIARLLLLLWLLLLGFGLLLALRGLSSREAWGRQTTSTRDLERRVANVSVDHDGAAAVHQV